MLSTKCCTLVQSSIPRTNGILEQLITPNQSCNIRDKKSSGWILNLLIQSRSNHRTAIKRKSSSSGRMPPTSQHTHRLSGMLFKYGTKPAQVAFRTGDFKQQVIFIGGLTDGLLATEYLQPLSMALEVEKWSLVQPLLSSSYSGYGTSSLKQDALELDQLISYLINKEGSEGVVLLGHSTGCQDIVHYMRSNTACSKAARAAILQAPVSDREYRATLPETADMIDLAASMIKEDRAMDLMPREANPDAPITAYRYYSLCAYMGDDDMFSSDLSDDQLRLKLGHMSNTPCQVIFSMGDEYVPEYVDKRSLVQRLCNAMGGAEKVEIEWGNHSLSNRVLEAVEAIVDFVKREGPKGWDDPWH